MDWMFYAAGIVLHVWGGFYAVFFAYAAIVTPKIAGDLVTKIRFLAPFIGLVFFYSWVVWG